MPESEHYCADCDTHFGGPPNHVTPEQHAEVAHEGGVFRGIRNGNYKDWNRKQEHLFSSFQFKR